MPLDIRAMTNADLPAAQELWAVTEGVEITDGDSVGELERYLRRNPGLSTVAVVDDRVVAAVLCGHDGRRGFVYHLAVSVDHRGRGVGRRVMQRSLAALKQEGIARALLLVAADNRAGYKFWQQSGWEDMSFAQPMGVDL